MRICELETAYLDTTSALFMLLDRPPAACMRLSMRIGSSDGLRIRETA